MIAALGFLAAALSIAVVWPQVWLSCRHGRTLGLSPTGSWLAVSLNLCWLTFGLLIGDAAQIVTNAVVGAGNTAVLAALLLTQPQLRSGPALLRSAAGAAGLAALAAVSISAVVVLGADPAAVGAALGSVVSLVGAAAALPQLFGMLFDRSRDLSGMSAARWYLGSGSCASWVGYGWLVGHPAMWLSAGFGLCCAVTTCVLLRARRTTASATGDRLVHVLPAAPRRVVAVAA
jgi:uncharacterized protein with PQ loop repeat